MKKKNRDINIFSMSALDLFASAMGAFLLIAVMALPYYLKVDPELIEEIGQLKTEIIQNETTIATLQEELKKCREDGAEALKEAQDRIVALKNENKQLKEKLAKAQQEAKQAQEEAQKAQAEANKAKQQIKKAEQKAEQAQEEARKAQARADGLQKELSQTFCVIKMQWESLTPLDVDLHIIDYAGNEYYYKKQTYSGIDASLTVDAGVPNKVIKGSEVWVSKELKEGTYTIFYKHYSGDSNAKISGSVLTKSFTKDLMNVTLSKGEKRIIGKIKVDSEGQARLERH